MKFVRVLCSVASVVAVLSVAGCHRGRHSTTLVQQPGIFTTDEFPGDPVQEGNVADDLRAMSPAGADVVTDSFQVVRNGDRGPAIATYKVMGGGLFAQSFDGETWTPPVALTAADAKLTTADAPTAVAFLNTADHADPDARERDGDAIILWRANDIASGGSDGVNLCLFATQFDASRRDDSAANYGFQVLSDRLNTLHDGPGDDVRAFGFVSDGLCGEARWESGEAPLYRWGDATTGIAVFWSEAYENDPAPGADTDFTWSFATYDVGEGTAPEVPLTPGSEQPGPIQGFGASDAGPSSEETLVGDKFISYNGLLFLCVTSDVDPGSVAGYAPPAFPEGWGFAGAEDDFTVQFARFDLMGGSASGATTLSPSAVDSADSFSSFAGFIQPGVGFTSTSGGLYGSDEGLATLVIYTLELVGDPDGSTFGEVDNQGGLHLTEIDEFAGTVVADALLSVEDADISDLVGEQRVDTRISRNGDAVWVVWIQNVDAAPPGPSADDDGGLWVSEYITNRIDEDGNFPAPPAISSTTHTGILVSSVVPGSPGVQAYSFQERLGYRCGVQSDPDVMNLFYEHSNGASDQVWIVRLTSDLDPAGGVTPTPAPAAAAFETFGNGDLALFAKFIQIPENFVAVDSGEGGNVLAFFRQDTGSGFHTFARRTGAGAFKVEISSADPGRQAVSDFIFVACDSPGSDIGRFDPATLEDDAERAHPAHFVHVFFYEDAVSHGDGLDAALKTRRFDLSDPSASLDDISAPSAGATFAPPFDLGIPGLFPSVNGAFLIDVVASEGRVGAWFLEEDHVYYQEAVDDGEEPWHRSGNVSDPFLVDDDTSESISGFYGPFSNSCACDTLHGAMVFWLKSFGASSQIRLQSRARSTGE